MPDLREVVHQNLLGMLRDGDAPRERASGRKGHLHGEVPLVERRDELGAQTREEQQAPDEGRHGHADRRPAELQADTQTPLVDAVQPYEEAVGKRRFGLDAPLEEERRHHRHVGQREEQHSDNTEYQRLGHRREVLALDARQRQDREEDDQDDDHGEGCRAHHVARARPRF